MRSPALLIIVLIVGAIAVASVAYNYTRETTSQEFKYSQPAEEIDATYYTRLALITIKPPDTHYHRNICSTCTPKDACLGDDVDLDLDGWLNSEEKAHGTQCDNPDTDGDGIIDSIDSEPTNSATGGAIEILPLPAVPFTPTYQLWINTFYKNVFDQTLNQWQNSITASIGNRVRFLIYVEITNNHPTEELPFTITDQLGKSLDYVEDSTGTVNYYRINGGPNNILWDGWIQPGPGLTFNISPATPSQKSTIIEIYFEAIVWDDPANPLNITLNSAKITTDFQTRSDFAFIKIKPITK